MQPYNNEITKLSQAYLFADLYNKGFIKSKSFSFTGDAIGLQNKIMYIIKSSVNKAIKDNNMASLFSSPSFSYNSFKIHIILDNLYGKNNIFKTRVRDIINNATLGLNNVMRLDISGSLLRYSFDNIYQIFNPLSYLHSRKRDELFNLKEELDSIVNCIMFVPNSIVNIGNLISEIKLIDENYNFTLRDIFDYLVQCNHIYGKGKDEASSISSKIRELKEFIGEEFISTTTINIPKDLKYQMQSVSSITYYINDDAVKLLIHIKEEVDKING